MRRDLDQTDRIRQLEREVRALRDWTGRLFTRFPTNIPQAGEEAKPDAIVFTPSGGIPARVFQTPGVAHCLIYRIEPAQTFMVFDLDVLPVYNISLTPVAANIFTTAHLTKNDALVAVPPGGGKGGGVIAKTPTGSSDGHGIPGRTGDTPGQRLCTLYTITNGLLVPTGLSEAIYNLAAEPVGLNKWIQAKREETSGLPVCDWEEC